VQERLVAWLRAQGYRIIRTADTSSKEHGRDVVARAPSGRELWVTAKGYRKKTPSTSPNAQARHSVEAALLDLLLWRGEGNCDADLAIALPRGRTTYRNLMSRLGWARSALPFTVLWVADDGTVTPELPTDQ